MIERDRIDTFHISVCALSPHLLNAPGDQDVEYWMDALAVLRLIQGEVRRRSWTAAHQAAAAQIVEDSERMIQEIMAVRRWGGEGEPDADGLILSWITGKGPRRYFHVGPGPVFQSDPNRR